MQNARSGISVAQAMRLERTSWDPLPNLLRRRSCGQAVAIPQAADPARGGRRPDAPRVGRARRAVARAGPDRGTPARTCRASALIGLRIGGALGLRPGEQHRTALRAAAEGRRLLEQRAGRVRSLRRRRSGGQARGVAARLAPHAGAARLRAGVRRPRQLVRRPAAPVRHASRCSGRRGSGERIFTVRCERGAADRADDRPARARRRRHPRRWTSTGTAAAIPMRCAATRFRSSRASSAWRR